MMLIGIRPNCGLIYLLLMIVASQLWLGCATEPKMTRLLYEDRSVWVRLEADASAPTKGEPPVQQPDSDPGLTSGMLASWMRGFRVETDRGPIGMLMGRPGSVNAFVEAEITTLAPHFAKGLKIAGPNERLAYCMTVDYSETERFITTGWLYVRHPYLYFKLKEHRTPIRVASPAVSTADACRTKPLPGVATADRFFRLDYEPEDAVVKQSWGAGLMAGTDLNKRGEVVFKLSRLFTLSSPVPDTSQKNGQSELRHSEQSSDTGRTPIRAGDSNVSSHHQAEPTPVSSVPMDASQPVQSSTRTPNQSKATDKSNRNLSQQKH